MASKKISTLAPQQHGIEEIVGFALSSDATQLTDRVEIFGGDAVWNIFLDIIASISTGRFLEFETDLVLEPPFG